MHHQQQLGLDFDHPLRSYMLQAYARIGRCLGRDFAQYLHMIMPSLLESANMEAETHTISYGDDDNGGMKLCSLETLSFVFSLFFCDYFVSFLFLFVSFCGRSLFFFFF